MKLALPSPIAPTRRLAVVALLAAPVWLLSGTEFGFTAAVVVSVAVVVAAILDLLLTPTRSYVQVTRTIPATAGIGDPAMGRYGVASRWPMHVSALLVDNFPSALDRTDSNRHAFGIPPMGEVAHSFTFTPVQRGPHSPGQFALQLYGPLGFICRTVRVSPNDSVLVTPSLTGVRRYRLLALQHRLRDAGVRAVRRRGQGTNFANLRDYAVGDDPRRVDWKATARRGRVITREFTVEQGQTIMIAVDAGRMMTQLSHGLPRFEHALSAALVLADVAVHSKDQVGLIVFDDEIRAFVPPSRGRVALAAIRDALVVVRPTMVEPDYAMAFRTLESRHRKRSLIVLFTDVIDTRSSQAIVAHTARSAVRHLPLVVALRNDQLAHAAMPQEGTSSIALYESAAAEELVSAREEALVRMRRSGVSVLDISPQVMTAAVVNRYLELKARASL